MTLNPISGNPLADDFKQALSSWPSGVTVVTTRHNGESWGFTASSFCSVSLTPPMVLVCVDVRANCHDAFAEAEKFAVNVLSESQSTVGQIFATKDSSKFEKVVTTNSDRGLPVLDSAVATIECERVETLRRGDHSILLGSVLAASASEEDALVYFRRGFHRLEG